MHRRPVPLIGILVVSLLRGVIGCSAGQSTARFSSEHFTAQISEAEQEAAYVWGLIENIDYFRERGYSVSLPEHEFIDELVDRQRRDALRQSDYEALKQLFGKELYRATAYRRAYRELGRALAKIEKVYDTFVDYSGKWGFKVVDRYEVRLTLYGPGGMFDPEEGIIWIMITDSGSFKMNSDPSYVVIHEATHIGVDEIVQAHGLPQPVIERIVDKFVVDHFSEILPQYRMQEWTDTGIDPCLAHPDTWERFPEYVEMYVEESSSGP